jgi:hypothetical protein
MIDITTIQTFKVSPTLKLLQETNNSLKISNEVLSIKNERLKNTLIFVLGVTGIGVFFYLIKTLKTNKHNENSNHKLR